MIIMIIWTSTRCYNSTQSGPPAAGCSANHRGVRETRSALTDGFLCMDVSLERQVIHLVTELVTYCSDMMKLRSAHTSSDICTRCGKEWVADKANATRLPNSDPKLQLPPSSLRHLSDTSSSTAAASRRRRVRYHRCSRSSNHRAHMVASFGRQCLR